MPRSIRKILIAIGVVAVLAGTAAVPAGAEMRTEKIRKHLCKTTGGGRFVDIPGFPGERIDRRLLADIRWMKRNFKIFITDGYATSGHAWNGEHPIGLAADIVPNFRRGGTWGKIDRLANRFEPRQNVVRMPFRWIGYNGDAGHGRGHHLHLSWSHSDTQPRDPARVVYTRNCPRKRGDRDGSGDGGGDGDGSDSGGIRANKTGTEGGGLSPAERANLAPIVIETE